MRKKSFHSCINVRCLIISRTLLAKINHGGDTLHTDCTNNVICKRTSYIQTKHHVNFHYYTSFQLDMLQEGFGTKLNYSDSDVRARKPEVYS